MSKVPTPLSKVTFMSGLRSGVYLNKMINHMLVKIDLLLIPGEKFRR